MTDYCVSSFHVLMHLITEERIPQPHCSEDFKICNRENASWFFLLTFYGLITNNIKLGT